MICTQFLHRSLDIYEDFDELPVFNRSEVYVPEATSSEEDSNSDKDIDSESDT